MELPFDLSSLTPQQIAAIAILGLVIALVVISLGGSLWFYFTERELRTTFPDEYSKRKDKVTDEEPFLPSPQAWLPRLAIGAVIGLVFAAIGVLVSTQTRSIFPVQASFESLQIDTLFNAMLIIMVIIFIIVEGGVIFAAIRFRAKEDDMTDADPLHGNTTLEIVWTVIPALIVLWLSVYSFNVLSDIQDERPTDLTVVVTARQFGWEYYYPDIDYTSFDKLVLPINTTTRLVFRSADVIHSFWVPAFRMKRDAMPNIDTEMFVTPIQLSGDSPYEVRCAELCGSGHSIMSSQVEVIGEASFAAWLDANSQVVEVDPADDPIGYGRSVFLNSGCAACHVLTDANAAGVVGPDLNGLGSRAGSIVSGLDAEAYIIQSILEPNAYLSEGFEANLMPQTFGEAITPEDLDFLVQYLLAQE